MEWLNRMQKSIDYLEERLKEDYDIEEAARIACSSTFHFQRLFHMITGYTVAEYVRNRRMTLAISDLYHTKDKIIDIAYRYGYETPEAFTKAFKRIHQLPPSAVRKHSISLKAYPKLTFKLTVQGVEEMNYRIVEKEAFKIVGLKKRVTCKDGENFKIIPKFWQEVTGTEQCAKLFEKMGRLGVMGVCTDWDKQMEAFDYYIAIEESEDTKDEDWAEKEISAGTWAIFEAIGSMPDAIQKVWKRIYQEWFPSTEYEHAGGAELEIYYPGDPNQADYKSEVWIPITKPNK